MGRQEEAINDYSRIIEASPGDALLYMKRGMLYANTGKYDRSIEDFTRAIGLSPDNRRAYLSRAMVYRKAGQTGLAEKDEETAKRMNGIAR